MNKTTSNITKKRAFQLGAIAFALVAVFGFFTTPLPNASSLNADAESSDGYFQGGKATTGVSSINLDGTSGTGGLTGGTDRVHFGKANTLADGGATKKGWRVLGVGDIPSVELGGDGFKGYSTAVPENSAYIVADDQDGVGGAFGAATGTSGCTGTSSASKPCDTFDGQGYVSALAQKSLDYASDTSKYSAIEQNALVSTKLNGVCITLTGCEGDRGTAVSVGSYRLFPLAVADIKVRLTDTSTEDGRFFNSVSNNSNAPVATVLPEYYWLRSPDNVTTFSGYAMNIKALDGTWYGDDTDKSYGFRAAGLLDLNQVILTQKLENGSADGGVAPVSRWTGALAGDKKLVLVDPSIDTGVLYASDGIFQNNTFYVEPGSNETISNSGAPSDTKLAYKIVSRGETGDPAAGKVVAAGEGDAKSVKVEAVDNFWNGEKSGNLPVNHTYDLYVWAQRDSSSASDTGSIPAPLTLSTHPAPPAPGPKPGPLPDTGLNLPWFAYESDILALASAGFASWRFRKSKTN
jgi:hypothetical protein